MKQEDTYQPIQLEKFRTNAIRFLVIILAVICIIFYVTWIFSGYGLSLLSVSLLPVCVIALILIRLKKVTMSGNVAILGFNTILLTLGIIQKSAYELTFLAIIMIFASIITNFRMIKILAIMDAIGITVGVIIGKLTLEQPIDPEVGTYYANTISDLIPNLLIGLVLAIIIQKVLVTIIAQQKNQYEMLKQAQERIIEQEKMASIQMLAGGVAHDFNNLLTAIMGNINLIKDFHSNDLNKEVYEMLDEAEQASIRAQELTRQLMSMTKNPTPKKIRIVNLEKLIQDVVKLSLRGSNISFKIQSSPNLWHLNADPTQISQIIQNLVLNAKDAMTSSNTPGTITILITNYDTTETDALQALPFNSEFDKPIRSLPMGKYIIIRVIDTGPGIPSEVQAKLFHPFFTTKVHGTGLGLVVTQNIIDKHEGIIKFQSTKGKGTEFMIVLPAIEVMDPMSVAKTAQAQRFKGRVLVMDDKREVRVTLLSILRELGLTAEEAENGEKTLEMVMISLKDQKPYDLLILDLTVPGKLGGKETLQECKKIWPDVKAILSSGYSEEDLDGKCVKEMGFMGLLSKPYTIQIVSDLIQQILPPEN